ncbi:MAG: translation initiation factor IF-3 [Gemmatimonadetes bacterium]|nr:translation initiation factor IF-3 [Gemmatimonadota bacterium]
MERGAVNQEPRVNDRIRISPIRLIDQDGEQLGILPTDEARAMAMSRGMDLVEVAPGARPPVCKIMDYGRHKYEQARKAKEARKKQHTINVKEVKLRPKIETHDMEFKLRHARRFFQGGDKVKFTLMFRGREAAHPDRGRRVLQEVKERLRDVAVVESDISLAREGRANSMTLVMGPHREQH